MSAVTHSGNESIIRVPSFTYKVPGGGKLFSPIHETDIWDIGTLPDFGLFCRPGGLSMGLTQTFDGKQSGCYYDERLERASFYAYERG
ncbi:MAG: hypothetical protein A2542_01420 [Parcubacteria group bacterium RIFOXYD2_FULL_52_8]|nr:MAG: hypothetical protein A2542_01420 [Parcubacteria group bacterium RIFOXYD2_FULL_52_8]